MYGDEVARRLQQRRVGLVRKEGGLTLEQAAEVANLDGNPDIVRALLEAPTIDSFVDAHIWAMAQEHDAAMPSTVTEEVLDLAQTEAEILGAKPDRGRAQQEAREAAQTPVAQMAAGDPEIERQAAAEAARSHPGGLPRWRHNASRQGGQAPG